MILKTGLTTLTLIILSYHDIRYRRIPGWGYYALLLIGATGFTYDIIVTPNQARASLFALSLLSGLLLYVGLYAIGIYVAYRESTGGLLVNAIPSGDRLTIIGLSVIVYDVPPAPLITRLLLIGTLVAIFYGIVQTQVLNRHLDVPYVAPLTAGYLLTLLISHATA